jgi:flagellar biosynthetic protein FliO
MKILVKFHTKPDRILLLSVLGLIMMTVFHFWTIPGFANTSVAVTKLSTESSKTSGNETSETQTNVNADSLRTAQNNIPVVENTGFGVLLFKTIFALIVVIGLVYLGTWAMRKLMNVQKKGKGIPINVIGSSMLGPKKGIYLVEVDGRWLVLGVTDSSISYLTELKDRPEGINKQMSLLSDDNKPFRQVLDTFLKKRVSNE